MKRILTLFAVLFALYALAPVAALAAPLPPDDTAAPIIAAVAPVPLDCSGYAELRWDVDSQSWWTRFPGQTTGTSFGHTHVRGCIPLGQHVNGLVPFDLLLTMHDSPGQLTGVTIQTGPGGSPVLGQVTFKPALTCPLETTCTWPVHIVADVSKFPYSGYQELRFRAPVKEPDGAVNNISTGYTVYIDNGKPRKDYRQPSFIQGTGWYTLKGGIPRIEYTQSRILKGYPPPGPVSGLWTLQVECHANILVVTGCIGVIDPNFHLGDNGTVLLQRTSAYRGPLVIDTALLSPGPHRLVIRTDATAPPGVDSTASGVLGVVFYVAEHPAASRLAVR